MLTKSELRLASIRGTADGRPCDPAVIVSQMGRMTVAGISGGRIVAIATPKGEKCGVLLPIAGGRAVEVVLAWDDTYTVRRVRLVTRGKEAGTVVVESETVGVYFDELSEVAWSASCWK